MKISVLQHIEIEGPGVIADWAAARGHEIAVAHLYAGDALPQINDFDFLLIMGGPMSVNDESELPWLAPEKRLVAQAMRAGKFVMGICLGAQMMASALGARVYPNAEREIGWFPIELSESALVPPAWPHELTVLHWHGETFDLPEGTQLLASSVACRNQMFAWGERAVGLQFHLEATPPWVEALANSEGELKSGAFVQQPEQMLQNPQLFAGANAALFALLDALTSEKSS